MRSVVLRRHARHLPRESGYCAAGVAEAGRRDPLVLSFPRAVARGSRGAARLGYAGGVATLFGRSPQVSVDAFWRETAGKRGAEIGFRSYAVYLGPAGGTLLEMGGLLYLAGDTLWFEDFQKDAGLFGLLGRRESWVKTELSLPRADIRSVTTVATASARGCIRGRANPPARPVGRGARRLFVNTAVEIILTEMTHYFQVLKERELLALLTGTRSI